MAPLTDANLSQAVEDYIKAIYELTIDGQKATTKALAQRLGLGQGTVSGMLRQLARRRLVQRKPYYGASLTEAGRTRALAILRRHRLLELFLVQVLGYRWDEVDEDAERLEHAVSDRLIERIDTMLGHPKLDPHGDPIPSAKGVIERQRLKSLCELAPEQTATVHRVVDDDPAFLQYLHEMGIGLGGEVVVKTIGPFGTMQLNVDDHEVSLAREATERIFVSEL